jgi:hypothetical protein
VRGDRAGDAFASGPDALGGRRVWTGQADGFAAVAARNRCLASGANGGSCDVLAAQAARGSIYGKNASGEGRPVGPAEALLASYFTGIFGTTPPDAFAGTSVVTPRWCLFM